MNKMDLTIRQLRDEVGMYQTNERLLKRQISDKMNELDDQRIEFQIKHNEERRKYVGVEEECTLLRRDFDKKQNELMNQLNEKDKFIYELKREVIDSKGQNFSSILMQHSPIAPNMSMSASRDF